mmetsp:Transcript_17419/g.28107  ORF Transcript_17419/g.28107 Transcript_17419/m.28107 type:complete len:691 (-) Transcript_17419:48-2120(-)
MNKIYLITIILIAALPRPTNALLPNKQQRRKLIKQNSGLPIHGAYIATINGGDHARRRVAQFINNIKGSQQRSGDNDKVDVATINKYTFISFKGNQHLRDKVAKLPDVIRVENDLVVQAEVSPVSWGLNRIDQTHLPLSTDIPFTASHTGRGATIYVIDTGINPQHEDFGGRATTGKTFVTESEESDLHGHGTHCAGIAGGTKYGVAKDSKLIAVKVLGSQGEGTISGVIAGIAWAVNNASGVPAVLSLSLGAGYSTGLNIAARDASSRGMIVVVAAGNDSEDACNTSPAAAGGFGRESGVITVGSTTRDDSLSWFSNYGDCVDIFAPGSDIISTYIGSATATKMLSGTSMATPFVAGVAALMLEKHNFDKDLAQSNLLAIAVPDVISGLEYRYSRNSLLQTDRYTGPPTTATGKPTFAPTKAPAKLCIDNKGTMYCPSFRVSKFGPEIPKDQLVAGKLIPAKKDKLLCKRPPAAEAKTYQGNVVLVQRGTCYFYDKVQMAAKYGAVAVIIYLKYTWEDLFEPTYIGSVLADIPSVLITLQDGEAFRRLAGKTVFLGSPDNTIAPTNIPTKAPIIPPTPYPTRGPTMEPTKYPTRAPISKSPTSSPTPRPTVPFRKLTKKPTSPPTLYPTRNPTSHPTLRPTRATRTPTNRPTRLPRRIVTGAPTPFPTRQPTQNPTTRPTRSPTKRPTR